MLKNSMRGMTPNLRSKTRVVITAIYLEIRRNITASGLEAVGVA